MSKRVRVTFPDAVYDVMVRQATTEGNAVGADHGVGYIVRKAVRTYLNRAGCSAEELDRTDEEYASDDGRRTG
jgi:hypothetical protein